MYGKRKLLVDKLECSHFEERAVSTLEEDPEASSKKSPVCQEGSYQEERNSDQVRLRFAAKKNS